MSADEQARPPAPVTTPDWFKTTVRVRYAETDAAGIVYHANYLAYFEVARVELLRALDMPISEVEARGIVFPVVSAALKYRRPARLDDLLQVAVTVSYGPASFTCDYEVRRDGELLVTGSTRHAVCERATLRSTPTPVWLRALFERPLPTGTAGQ